MDLEYGPEYDEFRAEVKSFVKENEGVNLIGKSLRSSDRVDWQQKLIDHGYFARSIPKEYGGFGGDMDILKTRIIAEEFSKSPIPKPLGGQGIQMLVPTLLELGTEEQKQAYVKPTLRGETLLAFKQKENWMEMSGLLMAKRFGRVLLNLHRCVSVWSEQNLMLQNTKVSVIC